jgi:hypothetical protein
MSRREPHRRGFLVTAALSPGVDLIMYASAMPCAWQVIG